MAWYTILLVMGVPTAFTGFCFWLIERRITKNEDRKREREEARRKNEVLTIKGINASIALGEACALALKNGHTNGETEEALRYAKEVKHEQKDFLQSEGIANLYN